MIGPTQDLQKDVSSLSSQFFFKPLIILLYPLMSEYKTDSHEESPSILKRNPTSQEDSKGNKVF